MDWLSGVSWDKGLTLTCRYAGMTSPGTNIERQTVAFAKLLNVTAAHTGFHIALVPGNATNWTTEDLSRKDDLFITEAIRMQTASPSVTPLKIGDGPFARLDTYKRSEAVATRWEQIAGDNYFYHSNWVINTPYIDPTFNLTDFVLTDITSRHYGFELTAEGIHVFNNNSRYEVRCTPNAANMATFYTLAPGELLTTTTWRAAHPDMGRIPVTNSYNHSLSGLTTQCHRNCCDCQHHALFCPLWCI